MKTRKAFCIALVLLVSLFLVVSCDADIRSTLSNIMGGLSTNVYEKMNMVTANTDAANAVVEAVSHVETETIEGTTMTVAGQTVTVPEGVTTTVKPLGDQELKDLTEALASNDTSVETVKSGLAEPVEDEETKNAVQGTLKVLTATLDAAKEKVTDETVKSALEHITLPEIEDETMTKADVVSVQLIYTTLSSVTEVMTMTDEEITEDKIVEKVGEAVSNYQVYKQLTGGSDELLTGDVINTLLGALTGSAGKSRAAEEEETSDIDPSTLSIMNTLVKNLCAQMGVTKGADGNYKISEEDFKKFLASRKRGLTSLKLALLPLSKSKIPTKNITVDGSRLVPIPALTDEQKKATKFGLTDLLDYIISVVFTEMESAVGSDNICEAFNAFLKVNPDLAAGTLTSGEIHEPDPAVLQAIGPQLEAYISTNKAETLAQWNAHFDLMKNLAAVFENSYIMELFIKNDDGNYTMVWDLVDAMGKALDDLGAQS